MSAHSGSQCFACKHYQSIQRGDKVVRCAAFPDGIPMPIFLNKIRHDKPYQGDNGIQWEVIDRLKPEGTT